MRNQMLRRMPFICALSVVAAAITLATPALAHHSFSVFDSTKTVTLTGTIKEFQWTNPHTFTWIDVPNPTGGADTWAIEGMSPNYLGRRGWSKNTLKPGDKVSVIINPLKDGSKGGTFLRCTLADGSVMVMFANPPQENPR
jgi:hypothetical protein